jgi:glycosyltransferase involved in cell wall biosynthesis
MVLHKLYYLAKPIIPLWFRLALRRALAIQLRRQHAGTWPINEAACKAPDNWPGWPRGKQFAFVITHDVEGKRGLERLRELADLEVELGFRSAFNFVPEGEYRVPDSLRGFLEANGFEVGVHDLHHDGSLYSSWETFRSGAKKINQYIEQWGAVGFRSGFMRHDLKWLDELSVLYDGSTFDTDPFEPQPDGAGTIFPFWVSQDGHSGYVEIPYTLPQDSTLFLILKETSIDIWKRKLDWVAQKGGLALVNIHPDYISFNGRVRVGEYHQRLIREFLEYVISRYAQQCWFALPKDVANHFYANMVPASASNRRLEAQRHVFSGTVQGHKLAGESGNARSVNHPKGQDDPIPPLQGKRMASVSFSPFPGDPRPRRAAETFLNAGMMVDVICLMEEASPEKDSFKGIEIDRIPIRKTRGSKLMYVWEYCAFIAVAFFKLAVRTVTKRYHIVHIHNMPDVLVFAALVPKLFGSKVILDLHDPMPELMRTIFKFREDSLAVQWLARLEKWSIAFADKVITVNRACEQIFASRSCTPAKVSVIMNAPDEKIFQYVPAIARIRRTDGSPESFVIMYHGTLVERNGLDLAVEALAKVRRSVPSAELKIYGPRTPFLDEVLRTLSEKGLEKAVQYLGPKRLEELVHAISECDVGVIPNKRSIFTEINTPTRIFEYLALGKPVVAPRAPGIQAYFDEASLVLFELGDVDDLAAKLAWVATHPQEALDTTRRGQSIYLEHTWSREKEKLLNYAVGLLKNGDTGR